MDFLVSLTLLQILLLLIIIRFVSSLIPYLCNWCIRFDHCAGVSLVAVHWCA